MLIVSVSVVFLGLLVLFGACWLLAFWIAKRGAAQLRRQAEEARLVRQVRRECGENEPD